MGDVFTGAAAAERAEERLSASLRRRFQALLSYLSRPSEAGLDIALGTYVISGGANKKRVSGKKLVGLKQELEKLAAGDEHLWARLLSALMAGSGHPYFEKFKVLSPFAGRMVVTMRRRRSER